MNLSTTYMGIKLKSPLVPSACQPLTEEISSIRKMEDAGAGAVVLYSLFEEQLRLEARELDHHMTENADSFSEATSFFPEPEQFLLGPEEYLNHIRKAKEAVDIPIVASLNGSTRGGWLDIAAKIEQAGADALELNIYNVPTDPSRSGSEIEKETCEIVQEVKKQIKIPVAVKISPFYTNMAAMAKRLTDSGANGLVLFNRFYQPDIDLEELQIRPDIILSSPLSLRLPLRWIAILYGRVSCDLAATSGIHKAEDVIKMLMAGASVTMLCSVLLRYGIEQIRVIDGRIRNWMEEHEYQSIETMQGSMSQMNCEEPASFERAQYIRALHSFRPKHETGNREE